MVSGYLETLTGLTFLPRGVHFFLVSGGRLEVWSEEADLQVRPGMQTSCYR